MSIPPEFFRFFGEILGFFHGFVLDFLLVFVFLASGDVHLVFGTMYLIFDI